MNWFEDLPAQCPPIDAEPCNGVFYRIAQGDPAVSTDFFSQRKLMPTRVFKGLEADECIVRSISLFAAMDDARKRLKLTKFRNANIAEITLEPKDGMIKKTFSDSHYSWWRSTNFDVSQATIIRNEE